MIGPKGSVSIAVEESKTSSSNVDSHTRTSALRIHHAKLDEHGKFAAPDDVIHMSDEPGHQELCNREQEIFRDAILQDRDLTAHIDDAINSLRIVLAADESIRTGQVVAL